MDKAKLQTLKGFNDYLADQARKRDYTINIFKNTFELFGFEPIETPAIEYQEVLLGKYGEEADKLVYTFKDKGGRDVALRYDQTVPTARVIAMHKNNIPLPWRRYQIQNVWRAEKPQRGRHREFLQCDIDIFGSDSPLADAEVLSASHHALNNLGLTNTTIKINDRDILFILMEKAGIPKQLHLKAIQTIDKLEKKGQDQVINELGKKGVEKKTAENLFKELKKAKPTNKLNTLIQYSEKLGINPDRIQFSPTLARGLDYYTGTIFEFTENDYKAGSIAGGGRYDNLIEQLADMSVSAVGIAFGFERIIEAMDNLKLFPEKLNASKVLVVTFGSEITKLASLVVENLRENNIPTEIYPDENVKLQKQVRYADRKGIEWVIFIGPEEIEKNMVVLKNMKTGKQKDVALKNLLKEIKNK